MMAYVLSLFMAIFVYLFVITSCQAIVPPMILEKGKSIFLECSFHGNATASITWQLVNGNTLINISTCNFFNKTCTNLQAPSVYQGSIASNHDYTAMRLDIIGARTNETRFVCLTDQGNQSTYFNLEVYAGPKGVNCSLKETYMDVEFTCKVANVYPGVNLALNRSEGKIDSKDFNSSTANCTNGAYGSGTEGDNSVFCTWRIGMNRMFIDNHFTVLISALISNQSLVNKTAVISNEIATNLSLPTIDVPRSSCPVGLGVQGNSIMIGTQATCKCVLTSRGFPPGFARWRLGSLDVGEKNITDGSSTVTIVYSSMSLYLYYSCSPVNLLLTKGNTVDYKPNFTFSFPPVIIEKGQSTVIECSFYYNITRNITWQLVNGNTEVNISTCDFIDNTCIDLQSTSLYRGFIAGNTAYRALGLNIISARTNETQFLCLADNGNKSQIVDLEVYASPKGVNCSLKETNTDVEFMCQVANVYPGVSVALSRREGEIYPQDFNNTTANCTHGTHGSASEGDYSVSCTWRIGMNRMFINNHFTVAITGLVSNQSLANTTTVITNVNTTNLIVPVIDVPKSSCPVGPGVGRDSIIKTGTSATCKCVLKVKGFPPGIARWTLHSDIVGVEDTTDGSSTVTMSYNSSDLHQDFCCAPVCPLVASRDIKFYRPIFSSSAPPIVITGLQPLIIVLGVLCSGIVSLYA